MDVEIETLRNIAAIVALMLGGALICVLMLMAFIEHSQKKQDQKNDA